MIAMTTLEDDIHYIERLYTEIPGSTRGKAQWEKMGMSQVRLDANTPKFSLALQTSSDHLEALQCNLRNLQYLPAL